MSTAAAAAFATIAAWRAVSLLTWMGGVLLAPAAAAARADAQARGGARPSVMRAEFIFTRAPFRSAHASTIVETRNGLVAAWFGGRSEGAADVGIWLSRRRAGKWSAPVRVATGVQPDGKRYACWNPVLFEITRGNLTLFYKVGPNPREWWGMTRTSRNGGATWGPARRLPAGILGPIKNKPVRLSDGVVLSPSSTESSASPSRWRVHFERSGDNGRTWTVSAPPPDTTIDAIQPTILTHRGGWLQALVRSQSTRILETWSDNRGVSWTALAPTTLPNPNAGIDAVTLKDGRLLLVYNHATAGRSPLNVAVSSNGRLWGPPVVLEREPGEYSYPAVIQTADSLVHVTYTWKRQRIKHVVIDPRRLPSPRDEWLDSVLATLVPKLAPFVASRDSLAIVLARDSASVRADSAVMHFRESSAELLKTVVETFHDSAFQVAVFPTGALAQRRRADQRQRGVSADPPDFAFADSLVRFLRTRGVWAFNAEGDTYYTPSEGMALQTLGPFATESMRAYLRLEAVEQARPTTEDATIQISLDVLGARLAAADSVVAAYPGALAFQQADWKRAAYLSAFVNGTENTPAFRRTSRELRPELRQALERYATRHKSTPAGKVVQEYLALLRASGYKDTALVEAFRRALLDAVRDQK